MLKKLLMLFLAAFMAGMISLQSLVVIALAVEGETPVSSPATNNPITSPIVDPTPSPTPTPEPEIPNEPVTSPIVNPTPTPTPSPTANPLTSPVLYDITPSTGTLGSFYTIRSFYSNLANSLVYVGNLLMPENTYTNSDNNSSISFLLPITSALESGRDYIVYLISSWQARSNDLSLTITAPITNTSPSNDPVTTGNITNLLNSGVFSIPSNALSSSTPAITSIADVTISSGASSVVIPQGTVITRSDNQSFDANALTVQNLTSNVVTGLETNTQFVAGLQWGLTDTGLIFNDPITLNIAVSSSYNGKTLSLKRALAGTNNWTVDGIVAPYTCVVANTICSFQATKASYYVATEAVVTNSTTSASSGSTSSGSGSNNSGVCVDAKPKNAPRLISAVSQEPNQVTLVWSKSDGPATYYLVAYGLESGKMLYGNPNIGDTTSYIVKGLSGNTTYYFKVRAGNHCMPGEFSNEMAVKISGGKITYAGSFKPLPATEFKEGVLSTSAGTSDEVNGDDFRVDKPFRSISNIRSNRFFEYLTNTLNSVKKFVGGLFNS